jgi:hypothetical protein
MKIYTAFLLFLLVCINVSGQTLYKYDFKQGYKFIDKAEKNLQSGNLIKTQDFITKAKISNYGFCGNAWASAHSMIAIIEVQLLNKKKEYDMALTVLDSLQGCSFGGDCSARDSLKIITLFSKFGKEKVKESFKKINTINLPEYSNFDQSYWVFLDDLNYKFLFNGPYPVYIDGKEIEPKKSGNDFYDIAKNQSFYKLLE